MSAARALKTADGHSAEAETAANEAAREARAEIIEQAEAPKRADASAKKELTGAQKSAAKDATRAAKADPWHRFIVDVWITNFNSIEFGIYKTSRNRAKSRQFTTDMDIFAEVIENGERTGLLGYREDLWKKQHRHGQAPGVQAFLRYFELARHHGHDARPQSAADAWRARPADHLLLHQHQRRRFHHLSGALGAQMAAAAGELLVLPAGGRQAAVLPPAPRLHRSRRRLHALRPAEQVIGHIDGRVFSIGGNWKGRVRNEHRSARSCWW